MEQATAVSQNRLWRTLQISSQIQQVHGSREVMICGQHSELTPSKPVLAGSSRHTLSLSASTDVLGGTCGPVLGACTEETLLLKEVQDITQDLKAAKENPRSLATQSSSGRAEWWHVMLTGWHVSLELCRSAACRSLVPCTVQRNDDIRQMPLPFMRIWL